MVVVRVVEVTDEHVKLDANPPLAGQELIFDIELVEIA
jgi:peptidylprolyl isomerase